MGDATWYLVLRIHLFVVLLLITSFRFCNLISNSEFRIQNTQGPSRIDDCVISTPLQLDMSRNLHRNDDK